MVIIFRDRKFLQKNCLNLNLRLVQLEFYFHEFDAYIANRSRKKFNQFCTIISKKPKTIRRDHVFHGIN